jgi:hypothetical protein
MVRALLRPAPRGPYDPHWLRVGTEIEREHTGDRRVAAIIAKQHLSESPLYYRELQKMERRLRIPNQLANVTYDDGVSVWYALSVASSGMCAYHGYKRNDSLGWGVIWAVAGAVLPVVAPAIALAQGFGKRAA